MTARRAAALSLAGLAALLLAAGVSGALSGASRLAGPGGGGAGEAARAAAAAFAEAHGTFDYREPGAYTARLAELAGGELRRAIAAAAVDPGAAAARLVMRARAESAALVSLSGEEALVVVEALLWRTEDGAELSVRQRVSVRLARGEGRWLVSGLRLLTGDGARAGGAR